MLLHLRLIGISTPPAKYAGRLRQFPRRDQRAGCAFLSTCDDATSIIEVLGFCVLGYENERNPVLVCLCVLLSLSPSLPLKYV